jgi:hypothetical protein
LKIKEAIEILKNMKKYYNNEVLDNYYRFELDDNEAIDKAIKVLERQEVMENIDIQTKKEGD